MWVNKRGVCSPDCDCSVLRSQQASTLQFAARRQPFGSFAQGSGLDMSASTAANDDSATPESESTTTFLRQRLLTWTCYREGLSSQQLSHYLVSLHMPKHSVMNRMVSSPWRQLRDLDLPLSSLLKNSIRPMT